MWCMTWPHFPFIPLLWYISCENGRNVRCHRPDKDQRDVCFVFAFAQCKLQIARKGFVKPGTGSVVNETFHSTCRFTKCYPPEKKSRNFEQYSSKRPRLGCAIPCPGSWWESSRNLVFIFHLSSLHAIFSPSFIKCLNYSRRRGNEILAI